VSDVTKLKQRHRKRKMSAACKKSMPSGEFEYSVVNRHLPLFLHRKPYRKQKGNPVPTIQEFIGNGDV
jgi:hypothetical protein